MANIICELLCYLKNKYGSFDNKKLCSIICDYYEPEIIFLSKDTLVYEVEKLNLSVNWPRPVKRRNSISDMSARVTKVIQEIIAIWKFLDENNLISSLPVFVASDLSLIPTAKFEDGDIQAIFRKLDKIEDATIDVKTSLADWRISSKRFGEVPAGEDSSGHIAGESNIASSLYGDPNALVNQILDAVKNSLDHDTGTSDDDGVPFTQARNRRARKRKRAPSNLLIQSTDPSFVQNNGHAGLNADRIPSYSNAIQSQSKAILQDTRKQQAPRMIGSSQI